MKLLKKKRRRVIPEVSIIRKYHLLQGDVVHITCGMEDGGGGIPWVPTQAELDKVTDQFSKALPEVIIVATHIGVHIETVLARELPYSSTSSVNA